MKTKLEFLNKIIRIIFWISLAAFIVSACLTYYFYFEGAEQIVLAQNFEISLDELNPYSQQFLDYRIVSIFLLKSTVYITPIYFIIAVLIAFMGKSWKPLKMGVVYCTMGVGLFAFFHLEFFHRRFENISDKNGVQIYYYGYQKYEEDGVQKTKHVGYARNPLFICNQALAYYDEIKAGDDSKREPFFNVIEWLDENRKVEGEASYLIYTFNLIAYKIDAPWRSGLANSRAVKIFSLAYELSSDSTHLETAESFIVPFTITTEDGGFVDDLGEGDSWYAEYPSPTRKSPVVLNGMLSILIALNDYYEFSGHELSKELFDKGVKTAVKKLPEFDKDGASRYDLEGKMAYDEYHILHISQLEQLFETTKEPIFKEYHDKWVIYGKEQGWM